MAKTDSIRSQGSKTTTVPKDSKSQVKSVNGLGIEIDQVQKFNVLLHQTEIALSKN